MTKDGDDIIDDQSPLTIDQDEWADIDKELKEFMGSDAESDSDNDSVASALSARLGKRKRTGGDTNDDEGDSEKRNARDRGKTGLRTVANAASENGSSGSRTPATDMNGEADEVIGREQREIEEEQRREEADEEESDDELARELEREMESMDDEGDAQEEVGFMGPIEDDG